MKTKTRCTLQGGMTWDTSIVEEEHAAASKPAKKPGLTAAEKASQEWEHTAIGQAKDMYYEEEATWMRINDLNKDSK